MRFRATIELGGKTATGIWVPPEVVEALGPRKRVPVRVTINGYTYRSTVGPYGGHFMLPLSAENREGAGVAAGDEVDVDVELDTEPRLVDLPADLETAINVDAEARRVFHALAPSHKKAYVTWVESAKKDETRRGRVTRTVTMLREGKKQP